MNTCALVGTVARNPHVKVQPETGQPVVSFTLRVDDGAYKTYIGIECYGRSATQAETLGKDTLVAVEGKIGWKSYEHKGEKRSTLVVMARQVHRLQTQEGSV